MQEKSIQLFDTNMGEIRVVQDESGEPLIVAADIAKVLGYRTASDMTRFLDDDEKGTHIVHTHGGPQNMQVINEFGFNHAILVRRVKYIKDERMQSAVRKFQRRVTHEILPSIRKHGGYIEGQQDFIDGRMTNEEMVLRSMKWLTSVVEEQKRNIADLKDQNAALTEDNDKMRPKALFADSVTASSTSILVGELSTILQQNGIVTGQNRLFEFLRREGYLKRGNRSDHNMPTQRSMELGLFEIAEKTITGGDGRTRIVKTPKVTGKGQVYFVNLFNGNAARASA